jgi:DNA repair photolyase
MSDVIYIPKGKAREYSPYALNIYNGCDHDCKYCYVKIMPFPKYRAADEIEPKENILENLEKQLKRQEITDQVLLCFMGDPYCKADIQYKTTREVLKILLKYNIPTAILSKGGNRILRDIDLFEKFENIKIGATLTLIEERESLQYEPGAALPRERMKVLRILHDKGIKTWVSFEPIINPLTTYKLLELSYLFVDQYMVGKMNHHKSNINWKEFGDKIYKKLMKYNKRFYIKKDLYKYMNIILDDRCIDQDYLSLKKPRPKTTAKLVEISQPTLF